MWSRSASASVVADNARVAGDDSVRVVRDYFDALGAAEWDRLVQSPSARVALELHCRFLRRFGFEVRAPLRTADDQLPVWLLVREPVSPSGGAGA